MQNIVTLGVIITVALAAVMFYINGLGSAIRAQTKEGWEYAAAKMGCNYFPGFFLTTPRIGGKYRIYGVDIRSVLLGYAGTSAHTVIQLTIQEARSYRVMAGASEKAGRPAGLEDMGYSLKGFHGLLYAKGISDRALPKLVPENWLQALLPGEEDSLWVEGKNIRLRLGRLVTDGPELHALVQKLAEYSKLVERMP
ncbi:MAG: hypothetical protein HYZ53_19265 [Planctomycetes bacterium]|nr:hypothetical protein [Planctomycetota bacterium]